MEITKEEMESYEAVRVSGVTNMLDVKTVSNLSGLNKEQIIYIMKHCEELMDKFGIGD